MESLKTLYLYGITDHPEIQALLDGIQTPSPVRCLPIADLGALVREVTLEEFGEDALQERLKDAKWLEEQVRNHAGVLETAMRFGTVIPMKFLTIFRTEERLLQSLLALLETLHQLCGRLQGKQEWGVKVFCDLKCIQEAVKVQNDTIRGIEAQLAGKPSGTAYLIRRQFEELVRRESGLRLAVHLESICCRLFSEVQDTKFNPATPGPGDRPMVLNASLLIDKTCVTSLAKEVDALRQEYRPRGFAFELVGPFPPYSFSELPARSAQGEAGKSEDAAHA